MKKYCVVFFFLLSASAFAQFSFGLKGGMNSADLKPEQLLITNQDAMESFTLAVKDAKYGFHIGGFFQVQMGKRFFIQPELLFNSNNAKYEYHEIGSALTQQVVNESYQYLDIPVQLGMKFGFLRLQAGPVAHVFLDSTSDLFDIDGYSEDFKKMTLGYQAGIGFDIGRMLMLDIRYDGSLAQYGNHIEFFGKQYAFHQKPGRLMASIGFRF